MPSTLQIKRRLVGGSGSPGNAGSVEGELAVNAQDATHPELWFFGGDPVTGSAPANKGWLRLNPAAPAPTVGAPALTGGTTGSKTGIGAAWTALASKPTDPIIIASYAGSAYMKVGAGGSDADWAELGSSTQFANAAETLAGTESNKAISPAGLESRITKSPDATPANDANHLVGLNAQGKIDAGFLAISPLTFRAAPDVTQAYVAPSPAWNAGDFGIVPTSGTADTSWNAVGVTGAVQQGDLIVYDGSEYLVIANEEDLSAYVARSGVNSIANDMAMNWTASAADRVIIDGGDATKSQIENVRINCGTY